MFNQIKQLSKETLIYGVSTVLGRFLNFILVPFYTNVFPTAEFGIYSNIYAWIGLFNILFIYGMDATYLKFGSLPELRGKKETFSTVQISVTITSALFMLAILAFEAPAAAFASVPFDRSELVTYAAVILALDALTVVPFIHLRLTNRPVRFSAIRIVNIVINITLNLVFVLVLGWGIEAILIANLIASAANVLMLLPVLKGNFVFRFDFGLYRRFLRFGLPYLPGQLGAMAIRVADRPILELLAGKSAVGIYNANYKLGVFMLLFVAMFQYAWQPFFLKSAEDENAKALFAKIFTLFVLVCSAILIPLSLFISDIAQVQIFGKSLIGSDYWSGLHIVPIILMAQMFYGFYVNFVAGLYIEEKMNSFPVIMGIGAAVNIGANFLLIPVWGITGAALGAFIGFGVVAVGFYWVSQRIYGIPYEMDKIGKIFLAIGITGAGYYWLQWTGGLTILFKFILLALFPMLLLAFKVIDIDEIKRLLHRLKTRK